MSIRPRRSPVLRLAAPIAVLLVGVGLTGSAAWYARNQIEEARVQRFSLAVLRTTNALRQRLGAYEDVLLASRGLFVASRTVDADEFQAFVAALRLRERYPGIQGVGWATWLGEVPGSQGAGTQGPMPPAAPRSEIVFLAPLDARNRRALGYDMYGEPVRREAMSRARDTGDPATSGRVILVQETTRRVQAGFLIYVPVYRNGVEPQTLSQRREALQGWVYAPFRAGDFFSGVFPEDSQPVEVEAYDGIAPSEDTLLFQSRPGPLQALAGPPRLSRHVLLDAGGRAWTLLVFPRDDFWEGTATGMPWVVVLAGLGLTGFLFTLILVQVRGRVAAERAGRRATFLAEAGTLLAESLDLDTTLRNVAQLAVPTLGDYCAVELVEDGRLHQKAVVARDPRLVAAMRRAPRVPRTDSGLGISHALVTGRSQLFLKVGEQELAAAGRTPEERAALQSLGLQSGMVVPLKLRGQVLGVLSFGTTRRSGRRYTPEDLDLAEELARRASLAVDNARLYREAKQAVEVRDEFLSIASHELKTPLTSLQLQSQSVLRAAGAKEPSPERVRGKLESIHRQVGRLTVLINELLDVARITAGRLTYFLEPVDLAQTTEEVVERFREEAERADAPLRCAAPDPVVGQWDRMRLEQVITNLVSNAVKYGAGAPVSLKVWQEEATACLEVRDQGMGIDPEDMARIFERFERAVSQRHYGGMGLGLWIVRQILEGLGGSIEVRSEIGRGSVFLVRLPLTPPPSHPSTGSGPGQAA